MANYYFPETDTTRRNLNTAEIFGGEFDFQNNGTSTPDGVSTIAPGSTWTIDIREQRKYKNAVDYAPFNAISFSNDSSSNIRAYLNVSGTPSYAKTIFVASQTDRTYDLGQITGVTIKNLDSSNTIAAEELNVLFIKSSYNMDRLAERLAERMYPMVRPPALYERKRF